MRVFLEGLLHAWAVDGAVEVRPLEDGMLGRIDRTGRAAIRVTRRRLPFGIAWEVGPEDGRRRAHPSVQGAIRSLGALLAPERTRGRVVFAASAPP